MGSANPSEDDLMVARVTYTRAMQHSTTALLMGLGSALAALVPLSGVTLPAAVYGAVTLLPIVVSGVAILGAVAAVRAGSHLSGGELQAYRQLARARLRVFSILGAVFAFLGAAAAAVSLASMQLVSTLPG